MLLAAAQDAPQLSRTRYRDGTTSHLEVLTNETNYYSAEAGVARAIPRERLALVQVCKTLGRGWEK